MDVLWTWRGRKLRASSLGVLHKLKPLRNDMVTGIELTGTGISVDGVRDLVDLEVEDTDRAPEGGLRPS
jgi:hypothetical protein